MTVNGVGASLAETNSVAIDGAAVTLTLATAVPSTGGQAVTVGYTPGTNPLQDLAGERCGLADGPDGCSTRGT